jgi:hypothetical protein
MELFHGPGQDSLLELLQSQCAGRDLEGDCLHAYVR